jgi:DNA repair protein RecO (recombination protein O)
VAATSTEALVLHAFPYGETSRIVRLLTREAGVQSAIARGALRPRSRYAVLEPFAEGTALLYIRASRELQTLGSFDLTRTRQSLGRDLLRFGGASLLAELIMRTGSEERHPHLYDVVSSGFDRIAAADESDLEVTLLAVLWHVVALLGFAPELSACMLCGVGLDAADRALFDYAAGGLRCNACAAGLPGRSLPAHARAALAAFSAGHAVRVDVTAGHWRLLRRYLEHHVLEGATLRSHEFLAVGLAGR